MNASYEPVQSIFWRDNHLVLLDQTQIPQKSEFLHLYTSEEVWKAIKRLSVRGAPAIGIAASYGLYLGISSVNASDFQSFYQTLVEQADYLKSSRPTAVNLSWALNRILEKIQGNNRLAIPELKKLVLDTAKTIHLEDRNTCQAIGEHGEKLLKPHCSILTHCNTGSLATAKYGTALSIIYHAHLKGKNIHVWVDETRPLLQGSRLTTWELNQAGINNTLIIDSAASFLMQQQKIDCVIVGADRIAANGDTANKIGTYMLAVAAHKHGIPFYVAAPKSTIDLALLSGESIPIEERESGEIHSINNQPIAPPETNIYNPAFDITPHELITAIITEDGPLYPEYKVSIADIFQAAV